MASIQCTTHLVGFADAEAKPHAFPAELSCSSSIRHAGWGEDLRVWVFVYPGGPISLGSGT